MENNKHFLEWITVEEFKCFSNFHAEGFKRVNLIGGKNNVGKTALMEAMYINVCSIGIAEMTTTLAFTRVMRVNINTFLKYSNNINAKDSLNELMIDLLEEVTSYKSQSNILNSGFLVEYKNGIKNYSFRNNESNDYKINAKEFSFKNTHRKNTYFYDNGFLASLSDRGILNSFNVMQKMDKEPYLNKFIKDFDSSIEFFKIIDGYAQCKSNGVYRKLEEFGDGLKSYISIICNLYFCQNGYLFIDEIDNGIYYEHFDRLWEIILTLSKEMNCQVFATTHSKEMLESFARVAKKLEEQDVSYTTLVRNKSNELKAITRDYEMLMDSMEDGREVR